jgi:hypothetical protein
MRGARSSSVGSSAMHDTDQIKAAMRYHERTKHQFNRYADGPGQLDWANQPNPFRRYEGAPLVRLPLLAAHEAPRSPYYDDLYHRGSVPSAPLTIHALSRLLQYALAISAWKQSGHVYATGSFRGDLVVMPTHSASAPSRTVACRRSD